MAGRRDLNLMWLVVALMATACAPGSAQPESAPTEAPSGTGQSENTAPSLVLSPGATSGGRLYQTWPLMMVLSIRLGVPAAGDAPPPDLTITSRQGAWQEALVVTIQAASGAAVRWPLHLVPSAGTQLALNGTGAEAMVRWWLAGDETASLAEGSYTVTIVFDPEKVDGLPTGADAVRNDSFELQVTSEPAPPGPELQHEKLYQEGRLALLQGDAAAAEGAAARLLAQDPESIGARRVQAAVAASQGKPAEALALLDDALGIYDRRFPDACPPGGLLSEYDQIMSAVHLAPPALEAAAAP